MEPARALATSRRASKVREARQLLGRLRTRSSVLRQDLRTGGGTALALLPKLPRSTNGLFAAMRLRIGRRDIALAAVLLCAQTRLTGQAVLADVSPPLDSNDAAASAERSAKRWTLAASVDTHVVPGNRNYVQPTLAAARGWLRLEVRYNYEALATGSVWLGYNLRGGRRLTWEFTPMVGGVTGRVAGIAPGFRGSVDYGRIALRTEGEYVLDSSQARSNFLYNFSELTFEPRDWLRFGLATQRTRVYRSELDIDRGFVVGLSLESLSLSAYVYDTGLTAPAIVLTAGIDF